MYDIAKFKREDLVTRASDFLVLNHYDQLWMCLIEVDNRKWQAIPVNGIMLFAKDQLLGNLLLLHARETMAIFQEAVIQAQHDLVEKLSGQTEVELVVHERVLIRWCHLPQFPDVYKTTIPKSIDANKLVMVRGTVVRAQKPKLLEYEVLYQCLQCNRTFAKPADLESYNHHPMPNACFAQLDGAKMCPSKRFQKISAVSSSNSRDYQEIKLQEQVQHLNMGAMPRSVVVVLLDEMVGQVNAGDDVTITGLVTHRWGMLSMGEMPELELMIMGSSIEINNERRTGSGVTEDLAREFRTFWLENSDTPLLARDAMLRSVCPEVFGMYNVKLAIAMVLAGGVRLDTGHSVTRGDSHLLMIGDPGTGKSQLLRFAAKMANRSVLTTGVGTTGAGLTATAVKDSGGEWGLEAGALVLADGGACCIDEFASIQKEDQTSIHEAMEQQTIHMAKAGLVCELHTRCAVLAATNPKSKYNTEESISMNVALGGPLLSRFDVVLVLLDEPDERWDKSISSFILQERTKHKRLTADGGVVEDEAYTDIEDDDVLGMFQRAAAATTTGGAHTGPERSSSTHLNRNSMEGITVTSAHTSPNGHGENSPNQRARLQQHGNNPHGRNHQTSPGESPFKGLLLHNSGPYGAGVPQSPMSSSRMELSSNAGDGTSTSGSQTIGFDESHFGSRQNGAVGNLMTDVWPVEKLQSYLAWVKATFKPKLSKEFIEIGNKYYARQRQSDTPDAARTTARLADSFVRIAQGHAKLMARHHVLVQDAIFAVLLLESSTFSSAIGGQRIPTVRSFFPADPDLNYLALERMVLKELGLLHLSSHNPNGPPPSPSPSQTQRPPPIVTGHSQFYAANPPLHQQAASRQNSVPGTPIPAPVQAWPAPQASASSQNGTQRKSSFRHNSGIVREPAPPEESNPHRVAPSNHAHMPSAVDLSFEIPDTQDRVWGADFQATARQTAGLLHEQPTARISTPFKPPRTQIAPSSVQQSPSISPVATVGAAVVSPTAPLPAATSTVGILHTTTTPGAYQQVPAFSLDSGKSHTPTTTTHQSPAVALTGRDPASRAVESPALISAAPPPLPDLIPLPPDMDGDFGVWEASQAIAMQVGAPSESQMDLDEDFMM